MRVVGSLTTIPGREERLYNTLLSLACQDFKLDCVYLCIPTKSRFGRYPEYDARITDLCTIVYINEDYGPVCKLVGALVSESDPNTLVITFDDDIIYAHDLTRILVRKALRRPDAAIGSSGGLIGGRAFWFSAIHNCRDNWDCMTGFKIDTEYRKVDVLCGFSGVIYRRGFFPETDTLVQDLLIHAITSRDTFFNDDLLISAYLSSLSIPRLISRGIPMANPQKIIRDKNEISYSKVKFLGRFIRSLSYLRSKGMLKHCQHRETKETVGYRILKIFILIIILSIFIF